MGPMPTITITWSARIAGGSRTWICACPRAGWARWKARLDSASPSTTWSSRGFAGSAGRGGEGPSGPAEGLVPSFQVSHVIGHAFFQGPDRLVETRGADLGEVRQGVILVFAPQDFRHGDEVD